jgi:hypothetical protein
MVVMFLFDDKCWGIGSRWTGPLQATPKSLVWLEFDVLRAAEIARLIAECFTPRFRFHAHDLNHADEQIRGIIQV